MTIAEEIAETGVKTHTTLSLGDSLRLAAPFLLLTLALFGGILFSQSPRVVSHAGADITSQFRYWFQLGFSNLRHGQLTLWNPHSYAGYPFFGNWQTALLYPFNWLHLILPWPVAMNWVIAIHFFLMGWFTSLWCRFRNTSLTGSALAGLIAAGAGGYYLHIYAGHLTFVCTAAWAPLILLCIDGLIRQRSWWWVRLGIIAVAMQLLGGFPQIVYYTALVAGIYTLIQIPRCEHPWFLIVALLVMGLGAAGIAAVQIAVGLDTASESVRGGGASMALASSFSLSPENLTTLLVPHFLGDMSEFHPYFGRWFLWETCIFVGAGALCLAIAALSDRHNRAVPVALFMTILLGVLALGSYTTLYPILYKCVPLYGSFRVNGRFGFFLCLFLATLAGFGYDRLRRRPAPGPWLAAIFLIPGLLLVAISLWMSVHPATNARFWDWAMDQLYATGSTILPAHIHSDPDFRRDAPIYSNLQFLIAGAWMGLAGGLVLVVPRRKWAVHALAIAAAAQILVFDAHQFESQPADLAMPPAWQAAIDDVPDGQRVYVPSLVFTNSGAAGGQDDIWGYDPFMPRRYAEFMAMTQGKDPDTAGYSFSIHTVSPLLKMVRLGVYLNENDKPATRVDGGLPQASIVYNWKLTPTRGESFAAMQDPSFDPTKTVLLETPPVPLPDPMGGSSEVQIFRQNSDEIDLVAILSRPGILLITDAYASGWRALGPEDGRGEYDVLPADWALRAIPLSAGYHSIRLVYAPKSFLIGLVLSWISLPGFVLWTIVASIRQRRHFAFAYFVGLMIMGVGFFDDHFGESRLTDFVAERPRVPDESSTVYPAEDIVNLPISDQKKSEFASYFARFQASLPPGFCAVPEYPFIVAGNDNLATVRNYARHEVSWAAVLLKNEYFRGDPSAIKEVWLFNDDASYRQYGNSIFTSHPENPFCYYSPRESALVISVQTGAGAVASDLMMTYLYDNFPQCPYWFNCGITGLYWMPSERNGHIYGYPNWRLSQLQEGIRSDHVLSIQDLITGDPKIAFENDYAYAEARYLCYYMQEKGLLGRFFTELQANIATDPTGFNTFQDVLGESDLYSFQSRWSQWILAQTVPDLQWVDGQGLQPK
ncbi:MAG: YfhO family protein [Tepidisphaeraceae bacterium]